MDTIHFHMDRIYNSSLARMSSIIFRTCNRLQTGWEWRFLSVWMRQDILRITTFAPKPRSFTCQKLLLPFITNTWNNTCLPQVFFVRKLYQLHCKFIKLWSSDWESPALIKNKDNMGELRQCNVSVRHIPIQRYTIHPHPFVEVNA